MADAPTADQTASPVVRPPGAIVLARHGEPALSRKIHFSAQAYGDWWALYEEGGLLAGQTPPDCLLDIARKADVIISSTRRRSIETAQAIAGGRDFPRDPMFIEAPLPPPPWPSWIKLSPKKWGFFSRFWWWFFDHHMGQESRKQAEVRADAAADALIALSQDGRNVLLVAHGFFNTMIGVALQKRGLKKTLDQGFQYWCVKRFERS
ncbi:histidine phosphatase family protein [Caulobacter sp. D4A]|uniref:phosphoglycerate mutase family protein n=1 Tax=unclassified Caulobacter TaxID=2648921 RepID=UPI000D73DF18|nr:MULTISPECIES: phosphoglycerate mutase family protein [unclassified Caulobacter]PXA83795.1 histidine phosphatase family protein [Caulobacter sp. D4A]PXA92474.1 histidine phosphatase family protein [Caulobacter sp. D5]